MNDWNKHDLIAAMEADQKRRVAASQSAPRVVRTDPAFIRTVLLVAFFLVLGAVAFAFGLH